MKKRIVCENLRSAYNVGNIIRTADALGWWVILAGYTARSDHKGVKKTALWAEESVDIISFETLDEAYDTIQKKGILLAAELNEQSLALETISGQVQKLLEHKKDLYLVVGNEVTGVEDSTLLRADIVTHILMAWDKESLNVGQAAAICMWELGKIS